MTLYETKGGVECEGDSDDFPQVPPACKRRRVARKAKATTSTVVEQEGCPAIPEEPRPKRRSACGVAVLLDRLQEAEAISASLTVQAPLTKRNSPPKRRSSHVSNLIARKPQLGRVRKCSTKAVELLELGSLNAAPGWSNVGYIFPKDFCSRTLFRSSVKLGENCWHTCKIIGEAGTYWPNPTFQIVADDNAEPILAKSATGAWAGILSRIKANILARRKGGEDLPPPSGTAIPGPEFFGLTSTAIVSKIEQLDPDHKCFMYWQGKQDRLAYLIALGEDPEQKVGKRKAQRAVMPSSHSSDSEADLDLRAFISDDSEGEDEVSNRWASLNRGERLQKRKGLNPPEDAEVDKSALLPGIIDPITLAPIQNPAMSPSGHVMGFATWKAVLAEFGRCPFTKQALHKEQLTVLTANNLERLRSRLILP